MGQRHTTAAVAAGTKNLAGQSIIVTGASSGIGIETARVLALHGATVILACRDIPKANEVKKAIDAETGHPERTEVRALDLASLASVKAFVQDFKKVHRSLDMLILNAGLVSATRKETAEGVELMMGVNHFNHYALALLLIDSLKDGKGKRIIVVSSKAANGATLEWTDLNWTRRAYDYLAGYGQSKLANILFANELNKKLRGTGIFVNSLHPGFIPTGLIRETQWVSWIHLLMYFWTKNIPQGAATTIYAAVSDDPAVLEGGKFLEDCKVQAHYPEITEERQKKLWEVSVATTGLDWDEAQGKVSQAPPKAPH